MSGWKNAREIDNLEIKTFLQFVVHEVDENEDYE